MNDLRPRLSLDTTEIFKDQDTHCDIDDYLTFLREFDWIHNVQVTHILKLGTLRNFNPEWRPHLLRLSADEINQLPFIGSSCIEKYPAWPSSLHSFLCRAASLSIDRTQGSDVNPTVIDSNMARGMNIKKQHEVSWMAAFVDSIIQNEKCNMVVDLGSGLGYLDHVLHQTLGLPVLGLETSESHVSAAEARAVKQGIRCGGVVSRKFKISNDETCFQEFNALVQDVAQKLTCVCRRRPRETQPRSGTAETPRILVIGLHCCGDLSPSVLSLFHRVECVKAMCCVCCCYHKMAYSNGKFEEFPISTLGQDRYTRQKQNHRGWYLTPYTLRLGAQETRGRWRSLTPEEHAAHTRHVAFRALVELTVDQSSLSTISGIVRKCDFSSFDSFLDSYLLRLHKTEEEVLSLKSTLTALYDKHMDEIALIELFTCLQTLIQPVVETLVYRDRLEWLTERGHQTARIVPMFDERISPRNMALVATKASS